MTDNMTLEQEQREEPKNAPRPSKHAVVMRGVVAPIFGLLAIASIILGVLNATQWKPSSQITAQTTISGNQYVVTDPGVLSLVDNNVEITVAADGSSNADSQVCVALGTAKDIAGWTAGHSYMRLTGLSDWSTLSKRQVKALGADSSSDADVAFSDSDLWSEVQCGTTRATLKTSSGNAHRDVIVDLGSNSGTATVSMHWIRQTVPDFAMPFYFVGGLCALLSILSASIFAMPSHKRRHREVSSKPVEVGKEIAISEAFTGSIHGLTSAVAIKPKQNRRRHASHRDGAVPASNDVAVAHEAGSPTIIDPSSHNMVGDLQSGDTTQSDTTTQSDDGTRIAVSPGEETSVISPDELQAYFARLSQEISVEDDSGDHAQSQTSINDIENDIGSGIGEEGE